MEKEESFFIPWLTRAAGFESKLRLGTTSRLIGPGQLNHPVKERSGPKRCVGPDRPQPVSTSISSIPSSLDTGRSAGQTRRISETLSGTFIKRHIVERTSKAEIRPEELSKKAEICQENFWNEIQLKGPQRRRQTQDQDSKEGQAQLNINRNIPTTSSVARGDLRHYNKQPRVVNPLTHHSTVRRHTSLCHAPSQSTYDRTRWAEGCCTCVTSVWYLGRTWQSTRSTRSSAPSCHAEVLWTGKPTER